MKDLTLIFLHTAASVAGYALIVATGFGAYWLYQQTGALEFSCVPLLLFYAWSKFAQDNLYMSWFPAYRSPQFMADFRAALLVATGIVFLVGIALQLHLMS